MQTVDQWIEFVAGTWWAHSVGFVMIWLDAVALVLPSEAVLVTYGSVWAVHRSPSILLTFVMGWAGAIAGDCTAYGLGRWTGLARVRYLQRGKGRQAVELARRGLDRNALLLLVVARYIPVGRAAVGIIAGGVRYPFAQFWPRAVLGGGLWSLAGCIIGAAAGVWFESTFVAVLIAIAASVVISLAIQRLARWTMERLGARSDAAR